ncbi:hypothetical protein GW17_00061758 [Ensete ventricosum]|nr:hypothetical protein GW17_00061758 [Ensete ventricosum]
MACHTYAPYRCTGRTVVRFELARGTTEVKPNDHQPRSREGQADRQPNRHLGADYREETPTEVTDPNSYRR